MLDNGRFQVVMYGPDGKYLRSYGKPGNGPVELAASLGLHLDDDVKIFVAEYTHHLAPIDSWQ
jgi:hypothetical protein